MMKDREAWSAAVSGVTESEMNEPLNNHIKCQEIKLLPLPEGIQNVLEERR